MRMGDRVPGARNPPARPGDQSPGRISADGESSGAMDAPDEPRHDEEGGAIRMTDGDLEYSVMQFQHDQPFAGPATPFRGDEGDVVWEILERKSIRIGDVRSDLFPAGVAIFGRGPAQTGADVGLDEADGRLSEDLLDPMGRKIRQALTEGALVVPELFQRNARDAPQSGIHGAASFPRRQLWRAQ